MEEWRKINNYPKYEVSSLGNVKNVKTKRILKFGLAGNSIKYHRINLYNEDGMKGLNVNRLVYEHFNGQLLDGYVIDHKDDNPLNNIPSNLQQITNRANVYKHSGHKGVIWEKSRNKWLSRIKYQRYLKVLGRFNDKQDAIDAYNKALQEIENYK